LWYVSLLNFIPAPAHGSKPLLADSQARAGTSPRAHNAQARWHRDHGEVVRVRLRAAMNSCERAIDRQTHWARMKAAVKQNDDPACSYDGRLECRNTFKDEITDCRPKKAGVKRCEAAQATENNDQSSTCLSKLSLHRRKEQSRRRGHGQRSFPKESCEKVLQVVSEVPLLPHSIYRLGGPSSSHLPVFGAIFVI
jgi:hypothetical protein